MKDFLKQVLAVIVGTLVVSVFSSVMMMMMFISMMFATEQTAPVTDGSVLHLKLSGTISERVQQDELSTWMNMATEEEQGLDDILTAIRVAETDDRVDGIYIEGGLLNAEVATLKEIRDALLKFKKSKKFVIAYGDNYTQGAYYVASVADKVYPKAQQCRKVMSQIHRQATQQHTFQCIAVIIEQILTCETGSGRFEHINGYHQERSGWTVHSQKIR